MFDYKLFEMTLSDINKELPTIPKPYFLSTVFPEVPIAICRPLEYPFDKYAITHYGLVFIYKDVQLRYFKECGAHYVDAATICYETILQEKSFVTLHDVQNIPHVFDIDRLVLERFYQIPFTDHIHILHIDGVPYNHHYLNLEAQYV